MVVQVTSSLAVASCQGVPSCCLPCCVCYVPGMRHARDSPWLMFAAKPTTPVMAEEEAQGAAR